MSEQISLSQDWDCQLSGFEPRIAAKRAYAGLKLWALIFRRKLAAMMARDKVVQCELMQLECEVKAGKSVAALKRVEVIKLMLSCVCLAIVVHGVFRSEVIRRRGGCRASAKVVHRARVNRGRRDEYFVLGEEALG